MCKSKHIRPTLPGDLLLRSANHQQGEGWVHWCVFLDITCRDLVNYTFDVNLSPKVCSSGYRGGLLHS